MAARSARRIDVGATEPSSRAMPYPPLPASPTLTNPDMILPDYGRADSPDDDDDRSQSPMLVWKNPSAADMRFHMPLQNGFPTGPITPTTPIIYGNGTMLSDIGEVTEVESNVGSKPRRTSSRYSNFHADHDDATIGDAESQRRSQVMSRGRRASIESTSTITTQDPRAHFADFDDAVSVDDSNFQGDDEESMASSYVEGTPAPALLVSAGPAAQALNHDNHSTSAISKRAEQILANAKKRLTTMEGNLTRARTSLGYSSMSDGSTPSPPMVRPSTAVHEPTTPTSPSHVRVKSDNSLQGNVRPNAFPQRSASALGAAGGYRKNSSSSSSKGSEGVHTRSGRTVHRVSHYPLDMPLEPLSEDEVVSNADSRPESAQYTTFLSPSLDSYSDKGLTRSASAAQMREIHDQMQGLKGKISTLKEQARADSMKRRSLQSLRTPSPFTHARWEHGFRETRSAHDPETESRGLEDGGEAESPEDDMLDREKPLDEDDTTVPDDDITPVATEDEAEITRSTEQAHSAASGPDDVDQIRTEDEVDEKNLDGVDEDEGETAAEAEVDENDMRQVETVEDEADGDEVDDMRTENGNGYDEEYAEDAAQVEDADYESDSGSSQYHEAFQNPVSHEDREDAFDYEHFFLHSAMGSLSQKRHRRRGSTSSMSSEDSVETTRGPIREHTRRPSLDTMSSADSFATATEGHVSRNSAERPERARGSSSDEDEEEPDENRAARYAAYDGAGGNNGAVNGHQQRPSQNAFVHGAVSGASSGGMHRPSISSFESTGTNRSFPLVNKTKMNGGILTPGESPDQQFKQISNSQANKAASTADEETAAVLGQSRAIQTLSEDDQATVQKLVASLGKCVLGLSEGSRAGPEGHLYRRRIEAAQRALEGLDDE